MIYLDANATTPLDPRVLDTVVAESREVGNASSTHVAGRRAHAVVRQARADVAALLSAATSEITFTSGATEANNLAILGLQPQGRRARVICSRTEHAAVLEPVAFLRRSGRPVSLVPVDGDGRLDIGALVEAVDGNTLLVSVMAVNNETGVVAPLAEIAEIAHRAGALLHTDATQLLTWGGVDVDALGVDLLSLSAHKFHGPLGVGALFVRDEVRHRLGPRMFGGGHEAGLRSGTLNTPGIAGLGYAARLAADEGPSAVRPVAALRDDLLERLSAAAGPVRVHSAGAPRVPGTLNLAVLDAPADQVLAGAPAVAASRGSACSGAGERPSHVLTAMGLSLEEIECSLRLSLHRGTTAEEVALAADLIAASARRVRRRNLQGHGGELVTTTIEVLR